MAEENRVHRFGCMGQAEENVSDVRILHTAKYGYGSRVTLAPTTTTPIPKYMLTRLTSDNIT